MDTIPQLVDRIVNRHHAYVRTAGPAITVRLAKLRAKHGAEHLELAEIDATFAALRAELDQHMFKEERILFPYVCDLAEHAGACGQMRSPFGTVENPIRMMEHEHDNALSALARIRELTNNFATPADVCKGWALGMEELEAFARDLVEHITLENTVLFPAAIALEKSLSVAT
ncbi:MAG TPA: hemerythrin domain-containing protein [Vicinamibacterales bacterium]|nr:hemerythrin domain-containing protein [Vicinamibacterales bacterium]